MLTTTFTDLELLKVNIVFNSIFHFFNRASTTYLLPLTKINNYGMFKL
jgi:hypothetical protein